MRLPALSRRLTSRLPAVLAVAVLPFLLGGWSWWLQGPQSTIDTAGPVAREQYQVMLVTLRVVVTIFIIVAGLLTYATLKFKARSESDEHAAPPPQSHGNPLIEIGLIAASVLTLLFIAVPTLKGIWYSNDVPAEEKADAYQIVATGAQWWFKFEYPGEGGLVTANELVIPAGKPVHIELRSVDVIHSFWVPKLAGKVDMIPNRSNHLWLKADKAGYFWGQCAEFCGEDHAVMRFRVIALDQAEFAKWMENQKKPARTVTAAPGATLLPAAYTFKNPGRNAPGYSDKFDADPLTAWSEQQKVSGAEDTVLIAQGRKLFASKTCAACHMVRGHEGLGIVAPDLTHVGARTTIAGGLLENTPQNLHRWLVDLNNVKPGNKMYVGVSGMPGFMKRDPKTGDLTNEHNINLNDDEARALVAYLLSLK